LQPFPRSKPGVRLSPHPAFRLGRRTWQGRAGRHRPRGAPVGLMVAHRHLPSALHPFAYRSVGLPWRTFTMSCPLPPGIGLLRRLRPPVRALAFSRPPHGGKAVWEFPSSGVNDVIATRSCLLYAGWIRDNMRTVWQPPHPPPSLLGRVIQPLAPVARNGASAAGSSRQRRLQGWSVICGVVSRCRTFVRRLQTPRGATARRLLRSPRPVVPGRLLRSDRSHC
jgi:hypothetical protein